jgi:plasmid stabilization system protein ParE
MTFQVVVDEEADADLLRLYDHLLARAVYVEDLELADRALDALSAAMASLAAAPFLYRKVAGKRESLRREFVVPFGADGYLIQYEIAGPDLIVVLGVRHQREEDCH